MLDLLIVEKRTVSTIKILEEILAVLKSNLRMVATYRSIVDVYITIRVTSNDDWVFAQRAFLVLDSLVC